MEFIHNFLDIFLHLDHNINNVIANYGAWTYLIVFLIIFSETGFVVTPFLPGDSLLFALGAVAATGSLNAEWLFLLLTIAAILGNTVNYWVGCILAPRVLRNEKIHFIRQKHLDRTHQFFKKYGGKTIVITRFVPIIRTFAPFLAGVGNMTYGRFTIYNTAGAILWVGIGIYSGYFFGNLPFVKKNFGFVILAIIIVSLIPAAVEFLQHRKNKTTNTNKQILKSQI